MHVAEVIRKHPLLWLLCGLGLLHGVLLAHDIAHPEAFMRGDRSIDRLGKTTYVLDSVVLDVWVDKPLLLPVTPDLAGRMVEVGPPGDYLPAGWLMRSAGRIPLIILQIALTLVAAAAVYHIGRALEFSRGVALGGALIFGLLPGTIVQAHLFVAEAWAIPSFAVAVLATLRLSRYGLSNHWMVIALVAWALAAFFRPQFALLPLVIAPLLIWQHHRDTRWLLAPLLVLATAPYFGWNAYTAAKSDEIGRRGVSITEVSFHLRRRLDRVQAISGQPLPANIAQQSGVSLSEFLTVVRERPGAYMRTVISDNADYLLNPGTVYLVRYLGLLPQVYSHHGWGLLRDRKGVIGSIVFLATTTPVFALVFALHGGLSLLAILAGLAGIAWWCRQPMTPIATRLLVLGLLAYNVLVIQLAYQSRWSLRQPDEVIASPFVAYACALLVLWTRQYAVTRYARLRRSARVPKTESLPQR